MNTGKERSLTVKITKSIAGYVQDGYPHTYYGRNEFTWNGTVYPAITPTEMGKLPIDIYTARLEAFKSFVESIETGLDIDTMTVAGAEAYRTNLTACPIG